MKWGWTITKPLLGISLKLFEITTVGSHMENVKIGDKLVEIDNEAVTGLEKRKVQRCIDTAEKFVFMR